MITWMQKHKKWLVITIWISTIAFVGAGFVGWGSYDYGKSAGSVAVVGDREVSVEEYQREYSGLYQQYQEMLGEQFNQEMAKKFQLHEAAINLAIQKNLILSYGDELGLDVTDEDIARELVQMPAFIMDGKFDKNLYLKILAQNRTNAQDFEKSLKRNLQLQKVEKLFAVTPNENEVKNLSRVLFIEDEVSIEILDAKKIKVTIDDAQMKKYWEGNKIKYMSSNSYELSFTKMPITTATSSDDEINAHYKKFKTDYKKADGKLKSFDEAKVDVINALSVKASKKAALKKYLTLKKGEVLFDSTAVMYEDKLTFAPENIAKIQAAKAGDVLKPFRDGNSFVIVKVLNSFEPKPLSYELAKTAVKVDFTQEAQANQLKVVAAKSLENFKGQKLGYISRESIAKLPGLAPQEAIDFLNKLFVSTSKKGQITVGDKVVLYEITNSRLGKVDATKLDVVKSTLVQLQSSELMTNLVKSLESTYDVTSSLDVKE